MRTSLIPFSVFIVASTCFAQDADISYTKDSNFKSSMLNVTNTYRDFFNATALIWNDTLVKAAEDAVDDCKFVHSGSGFGENLATGYANVSAAVTAWKDEVTSYNFKKPGFSEKTGHWTQLVWKSTTQVGCARKECGGVGEAPGWFIACEYYPPGNYEGLYPENVQAQIKGPGVSAASGRAHGDIAFKLVGAGIFVTMYTFWM